jgi:hypothetical protein
MAREIDMGKQQPPAWLGRRAGWAGTAEDMMRVEAQQRINSMLDAAETKGRDAGRETGHDDGVFESRSSEIGRLKQIQVLLKSDPVRGGEFLDLTIRQLEEVHEIDKTERDRIALGVTRDIEPHHFGAAQRAGEAALAGIDIPGNTVG